MWDKDFHQLTVEDCLNHISQVQEKTLSIKAENIASKPQNLSLAQNPLAQIARARLSGFILFFISGLARLSCMQP